MMTKPSHIFIVGSFRTGSHLLMEILNRSREVRLCSETFFLRHRHMAVTGIKNQFEKVGDLITDDGARRIVDDIYSRTHGFWSIFPKHFDKQSFLNAVLESDRSYAALFDIAMRFRAGPGRIPGEKTPAHISVVPTLLEWYPNAVVIQTIRDPRAVYVSNRIRRKRSAVDPKKPQAYPWLEALIKRSDVFLNVYMSLNVLITWLRVMRYHGTFQKRYPERYFSLRYEDLVTDPSTQVQDLCRRLGIEFHEEMLEQTVVNSSHSAKRSVKGFDSSLINKWRKDLSPLVNRWFILWCGKYLKELGYES